MQNRFASSSSSSTSSSAPLLGASARGSSELQQLGKDVWLIPGDKAAKDTERQPDIVVLFGWMDAKINHIQKYATSYRTLYPRSDLLIVQSHSNFFWSSQAKRAATIAPAVTYLDSAGLSPAPSAPPTLQLHAFSNGGAAQLLNLATVLKARRGGASRPDKHTMPASTIIIDSAPGGDALRGLLTAFTMPLPTIAKPPVIVLVCVFWAVTKLYSAIAGPVFIHKLRAQLLDPSILPPDGKRLYVYSKNDSIIRKEDVEQHIADARQAQLDVTVEAYENSPHVAHARTDGKRYWEAVKSLWTRSLT